MADWKSLPADLINRIADRLLATDDLDYYMDFRAVCSFWRSSTADPKNHNSARFWPRQWVMLDEVHQCDERLFVNPATGRFVRKDLALLLRRHHLIAGAVGGSLVLAERSSPHAVRLLNPFTGSLTRFAAPLPSCINVAVAHVIGGIGTGCSPPTLVLFCDHPDTIHWADPDSESFSSSSYEDGGNGVGLALIGGIYAAAREQYSTLCSSRTPPPEASKILAGLVSKQFSSYFPNIAEGGGADVNRCFPVVSAGEILIVFRLPHGIEVFKIGDDMVVQQVKDIGRRALFIGNSRCLSVDADKFASVDANSVYYVDHMYQFHVYSLGDGTDLCAGVAIGSPPDFLSNDSPPFSVVQLLGCYTYEVRCSELGFEQLVARSFSMLGYTLI